MSKRFLNLLAALLVFISIASSCSHRAEVPITISIPIRDPSLLTLAKVTDTVAIESSGTLTPGQYQIGKHKLNVSEGTNFSLSFKLPVKGNTVLSAADADGVFETTQALSLDGLSAPKRIELHKSTISGDVDVGRVIVGFLLNALHSDQQKSSIPSDIVKAATIKSATFSILSGSSIKLAASYFKFEEGSSISLQDVEIKGKSKWHGLFVAHVNLKPVDCKQEKMKVRMNNMQIQSTLSVNRTDDKLELSLSKDNANKVIFAKFHLQAGPHYVLADKGTLEVRQFNATWPDSSPEPALDLETLVTLSPAQMGVVFADGKVYADLDSGTQISLKAKRSESDRLLEGTLPNVRAKEVQLTYSLKASSLHLVLEQLKLGAIQFKDSGDSTASIDGGEFNLRSLVWNSGKSQFLLKPSGAKVKLAKATASSKESFTKVTTSQIPVSISSGSAHIVSRGSKLNFQSVSGKAVVALANNGVRLTGSLSSSGAGDFGGLKIPGIQTSVKNIKLSSSGDHLQLELPDLTIAVPTKSIEDSMRKAIPSTVAYALNKPILDKQKWRYRKLFVQDVTANDSKLQSFKFAGTNSVSFEGSTNINVRGTVERLHTGITGGERGWMEHPWSASGPVSGHGTASYALVMGNSLAESQIDYDAKLRLPVPDKLSVDWSNVSNDLLGKSEQGLIGGAIRHSKHFTDKQGIPIEFKGSERLFPTTAHILRSIHVTKFVTAPKGTMMQVQVAGNIKM